MLKFATKTKYKICQETYMSFIHRVNGRFAERVLYEQAGSLIRKEPQLIMAER